MGIHWNCSSQPLGRGPVTSVRAGLSRLEAALLHAWMELTRSGGGAHDMWRGVLPQFAIPRDNCVLATAHFLLS